MLQENKLAKLIKGEFWNFYYSPNIFVCRWRVTTTKKGKKPVPQATTDQSITCCVTSESQKFYLSASYGCNEGIDRRRLWSHLSHMHDSFSQDPWILAGDFNIIAHPSESLNYNGSQVVTSDIREFTECTLQLSVFDHAYTGPNFTWSNRQQDGFLARKLDRVLINDNWLTSFPHSTVEFLSPEESDYCAAMMQLHTVSNSPPKPFKVFNYWTKHSRVFEDC